MSTMRTAAGHNGGSTHRSLAWWPELPDDLLGMVRLRIDSPRDRVRMTAVCKPWRDAASRLPATPAVPMLILSPGGGCSKKHLCGPDGSWVMHIPSKAVSKRFVGFYKGGWVAATDNRELVIVNLFTGAEVVLSAKQSIIDSTSSSSTYYRDENIIKKIIFSEDPSSSDGCTLASLRVQPSGVSVISVCRVSCPDSGWSERLWRGDTICDMAFYDGELYGLKCYPKVLVRFEISMEDGTPVITATHGMAIECPYYGCYNSREHDGYIVELHGKMMMAERRRWLPKHKPFFKVFELVDVNDNQYYKRKWEEVTSFGDYALFLGCSKAVHLPDGERRGIKRNHIYYYRPTTEHELPDGKVYSVTSGDGDEICCREETSINDGVGRTGYYVMRHQAYMWLDRCGSAAWIYPPDF